MTDRTRLRLSVGLLSVLLLAGDSLRADDSLLTVGRLFGAKEFENESLPARRWSKKTPTYFTLEKGELLRHDPTTGKSEVVAPQKDLTPRTKNEPLKVEGYELSADETKVLIFTNSQRVWRRNTRGDYWLLDLKTRVLNKLGAGGGGGPMMFATLSPDGGRVAFVRDNNLHVQNVETMRVTPLTDDGSKTLINGTSDWVNEEELDLRNCFRWSPDGTSVLFWQFDTTGVSEFHLVDTVASKSPKVTSFAYPKVGEKNSATRLGVVPAAGGKVQWLDLPGDPREHYLPHADWTPDGKGVMVQQFNRLQTELKVFRADPATGTAKEVFKESDAAWLENENPWRWLDGGKALLWVSERSGWRHAYRVTADGTKVEPITKGEFDVMAVEAVDEAGGWLYYSASPKNATQKYLFRVKLDGSKTEQLSAEKQTGCHDYDISPDAKWAVHTFSNFTTPPVVDLVKLTDNTSVRTLADNAKLREKLAALKKPEAEFFKVPVGGGITLDGWGIRPPKVESNAKLPLLMYVYGEPHGQTARDAWGGPRGLWHWMLAQQGFVVASVDNRGTNVPKGREWRKSVHRKIGIVAPTEQAAAVRELLKRWAFLDPARVGSWGWSGGGSMSLNAIFRHPDLYRTAIAIASVPDQTLYDTIYQERYMGLPADNAAGYRDGSPITHCGKLRGNLLIVHGTGDDNCHYQGTERLLEELIAKGKRFEVLPYPNRTHAISEGRNTNQHLMDAMTRFLVANLQSPHAPAPDPVYETRTVRGWTVHINRELLAADVRDTTKALELFDAQLLDITKVVPKAAVAKLQKVPVYFNPVYPGKGAGAEYHPGADWLRKNGRDPDMARSVEVSNVATYQAEVNRMPWFMLHELAHAYHDRELPKGFANPDIAKAYARAKESGKYDKVERHFGNGKPNRVEKAYAMTTEMEYFAEATEAYFGRNDFFPFTRDELKKHDPDMEELVGKLWLADAEPAPKADTPKADTPAPPEFKELLAQATAGDARAKLAVAARYRDGRGVKRDYSEAMRWARPLADQGDPAATDFVGWMFFEGLGVKQNPDVAVGYFKAASDKSASAAWNLGQCYFAAQGVGQDVPKAIAAWKKAAAQGHGRAASTAAMAYLTGEGVPADAKEARKLAERAAELNDPSGLVVLGEMHFQAGETEKARDCWTKVSKTKPVAATGLPTQPGDQMAAQQGADLLKLMAFRGRKAEPGKFALVAVPHVHQGWNNCGASSCAMFARSQGKAVGGWEFKKLCPSPLGTGTDWGELLKASGKLDLRWKLVTFTPDDAGFEKATAFARTELDAGRPLVIDFKYTGPEYPDGEAGHTLTLAGYIAEDDLYVLCNPAIAAPGLELMTAKDLKHYWRSDHYGAMSKNVLSRPALVIDK